MGLQARVALFFYVMLGLTLRYTWGLFHPFGLIVLSLSFFLFVRLVLRKEEVQANERFPSSWAALATLLPFQALLLLFGNFTRNEKPAGLVYPDDGQWLGLMKAEYGPLGLFLAAAVLVWVVVVVWNNVPRWVFYLAIILVFGILNWQRFVTIKVSPTPKIDTVVVNTAACDYLRNGTNPYAVTSEYEDIYKGGYDYQAAFPYWPMYLYWTLPFRVFLDDIRYGSWAADIVTSLLLWLTARRLRLDYRICGLLPLVWLSFPVSLLILEQAWIDPILVMATAGLVWALVSRNWAALGIALGLVCGIKQYGVLIAAFAGLHLLKNERPHVGRVLAWLALTLVLLFVPFVAIDPQSFYERTIKVYLNPTLRWEALSWPSAMKNLWMSDYAKQRGLQFRLTALEPPGWALPALYLAVVALGSWRVWHSKLPGLRVWASVLPLSLGVIFLFGKIAFCNYYYYIGFLTLVYLLLCLDPDSTNGGTKETIPAVPPGH